MDSASVATDSASVATASAGVATVFASVASDSASIMSTDSSTTTTDSDSDSVATDSTTITTYSDSETTESPALPMPTMTIHSPTRMLNLPPAHIELYRRRKLFATPSEPIPIPTPYSDDEDLRTCRIQELREFAALTLYRPQLLNISALIAFYKRGDPIPPEKELWVQNGKILFSEPYLEIEDVTWYEDLTTPNSFPFLKWHY